MTKLLDDAVETVRRLAPASQDEIAHAMLNLARMTEGEPEDIDPAHVADILEGLAQAQNRDFASESEVAVAFRRFGQ